MTNRPPQDFWRSLQDLATRAANDQARFWQDYVNLWKPASPPSGATATPDAGEAARAATERTARFFRDYANLTTNYYKSVYELGRSYAESLTTDVWGGKRAGVVAAEGSRIDLRGPVGGEATASFVVENKRAERMDVDLEASDFSNAPANRFQAALAIEPARFTLEPGEERSVTLRLPLDPVLFKAGEQYVTTVVNRGDDQTRLVVVVRPQSAVSSAGTATGR